MTFLNLSLLGGAALVVLPVVLHLIMRQKPQRLEFPALRFIQKRHEANRRRLRAPVAFDAAQAFLQTEHLAAQRRPCSVGHLIELPLGDAENPAVAAHPEGAEAVIENRKDHVVEEPVVLGDRREFPRFQTVETAAVGSDPEGALLILRDRIDEAAAEPLLD